MSSHRSHTRVAALKLLKASPLVPSNQLARILRKKHVALFDSAEQARRFIRYHRGASGQSDRVSKGVEKNTTPGNPLGLPVSAEREFEPFIMDGCKHVGVIGDLHLPYHNIPALTTTLKAGLRERWDGILINGDLVDFHCLSRFEKEPGKRSFKDERQTVVEFLTRLRELFPKARIVYKQGNHCERLSKFVMARAPEIYDETIFGLDVLFGLKKLGIEQVQEKRIVKIGKLPVLHGHELPKGVAAPVNPARGAFMKAKTIVLVNHHHKTSEHTETTLDRSIITTWSLGCLCELRPLWEPFNGWNHGFASVKVSRGGDFHVTNHKIHEGALLN